MEAFVTLATTDAYALGAFVVGRSLREVGTTRALHCLLGPDVSAQARAPLETVFDAVSTVDLLDSEDERLTLLGRPDLGCTLTKIHCWRLTQYSKCVFLDADTLVVRNVDELFDHPELAAAPDIGWPDCFNSGVFVFVPSTTTHAALLARAKEEGSFDGGDQGLLNAHWPRWRESGPEHRLSFAYNTTASLLYTYAAAHAHFAQAVRIVHFLGARKPWHGPPQGHYEHVWRAHLSADEGGKEETKTVDPRQLEWEAGRADYLGADAFAAVQAQLDSALR